MRFLYSLIALCLLVVTASADPKPVQLAAGGFGVGNNLTGFWQKKSSAATASITFLQCATDNTAQTTYTFTSQNTGTASADRYTIVSIAGIDSATNFNVTSATVGGDGATEVVDSIAAGMNTLIDTAIYIVTNASGTSETVTVTFSEPVTTAIICLSQVNNLNSATAIATESDFHTSAGLLQLNDIPFDTQAGGIVIGICASNAASVTTTWEAVTERVDNGAINPSYSQANDNTATASTPLALTCDYSGSADSALSAAAFR